MAHRTRSPFWLATSLAAIPILTTTIPADAQRDARRGDRREAVSHLPVSTPETQGMDSMRLADGLDHLVASTYDYRVHSVVVLRHGHVVFDARFWPYLAGERHDIASVAKSFTSTLIGIAVDRGDLDLDDPMLSFFPDREIANRNIFKERITVRHLLSMRSGFACDPSNSEQTLDEMVRSPDWVQFTLDLPMAESPGQTWVYCSPNVHVLLAILEQATGTDALSFARRHLFRPLGITDARWLLDPQGLPRGWGDLHLGTLDMAKLGQLVLDGGVWDGRQLVSRAWIEDATSASPGTPPPAGWPEDDDYGLLWYLHADHISAQGRGGQLVFVYPDDDVVVALNAGGGLGTQGNSVMDRFLDDFVRESIRSETALEPNSAGVAALQARIEAAAQSTEAEPQPVPALPAIATTISGRTYEMPLNCSYFTTLRLTFEDGSAEAHMVGTMPEMAGGPVLDMTIGLDGVSRLSPGRHGCTVAVKGQWTNSNQFVAEIDEIGMITLWRSTMTFVDDRVLVDLECLAGGDPSCSFEGVAQ